jgi:carbon starvation protein
MSLWKKLLWLPFRRWGDGYSILALSRGDKSARSGSFWQACVRLISYRFYSKWLAAKVLLLNDERATPAVLQNDGKDYVPTNRWMVFGHHFAAILVGAVGGTCPCSAVGFLPGTLWILIGATLAAGCRHDSFFASIGVAVNARQMVKEESGGGSVACLISVLAIMIKLAVLALVVVQALAESPWAFTIAMTIPVALIWELVCAQK